MSENYKVGNHSSRQCIHWWYCKDSYKFWSKSYFWTRSKNFKGKKSRSREFKWRLPSIRRCRYSCLWKDNSAGIWPAVFWSCVWRGSIDQIWWSSKQVFSWKVNSFILELDIQYFRLCSRWFSVLYERRFSKS